MNGADRLAHQELWSVRARVRLAAWLGLVRSQLDRSLLLPRSDWDEFFSHPGVRAALAIDLAAGTVLAFLGAISVKGLGVERFAYLFGEFALMGLFLMALAKRASATHHLVPLGAVAISILYATQNLTIAFTDPAGGFSVPTIACATAYFTLNCSVFRKYPAMVVNALPFVSTLLLCVMHGLSTPDHLNLVINVALILLGCLVTQQVLIEVFETYLAQLEDSRRLAGDAEERARRAGEAVRNDDERRKLTGVSVAQAMSSALAHELNQPMGSALTFVEAAGRWIGPTRRNAGEALHAVQEAERQLGLAVGVLEAMRARASRGRASATFALADVIVQAMAIVAAEAGDNPPAIRFDDHVLQPAWFTGQEEDVLCVLIALLENALAAADPGKEVVPPQVSLRASPGGQWHVAVRDFGPGIAPEVLPHVWDTFFSTRGAPGLGLSIAREITERYSGSIWLQPALDGGCVANLLFPAARGPVPSSRSGRRRNRSSGSGNLT